MASLKQFTDWFEDDGIKLPPIKSPRFPNGKVYIVPSPSFDTGILLQHLANIAQRLNNGIEVPPEEANQLKFGDHEEKDFSALVLGQELLDEMVEDGVLWGPIRKVTQYAFTYFSLGEAAAEKLVAPKAQAPKAPKARKRR